MIVAAFVMSLISLILFIGLLAWVGRADQALTELRGGKKP